MLQVDVAVVVCADVVSVWGVQYDDVLVTVVVLLGGTLLLLFNCWGVTVVLDELDTTVEEGELCVRTKRAGGVVGTNECGMDEFTEDEGTAGGTIEVVVAEKLEILEDSDVEILGELEGTTVVEVTNDDKEMGELGKMIEDEGTGELEIAVDDNGLEDEISEEELGVEVVLG